MGKSFSAESPNENENTWISYGVHAIMLYLGWINGVENNLSTLLTSILFVGLLFIQHFLFYFKDWLCFSFPLLFLFKVLCFIYIWWSNNLDFLEVKKCSLSVGQNNNKIEVLCKKGSPFLVRETVFLLMIMDDENVNISRSAKFVGDSIFELDYVGSKWISNLAIENKSLDFK